MSNTDKTPSTPPPGQDSTVGDWFGQSVDQDAELAEKLSEELDDDEAEKAFEEQSEGRETQERRHGAEIDPDQGVSQYREE